MFNKRAPLNSYPSRYILVSILEIIAILDSFQVAKTISTLRVRKIQTGVSI